MAATSSSSERPWLTALLQQLAAAGEDNLAAVVFFGSRLLDTSPDAHSAADLFLVVDDYDGFYRAFVRHVPSRRSGDSLARLNRKLPPNVLSYRPDGTAGAKCFVIDRRDFRRALSRDAADHFCHGRLSQRVEIVFAKDDQARAEVAGAIETSRRLTAEWVPLFCEETFSLEDFCLRMLQISYAGEIRPENEGRVREVFDAQPAHWPATYDPILGQATSAGHLQHEAGRYRLARPPQAAEVKAWKSYFRRSRQRATLRWFKYVLTFEGWLDYIARKAERRTGVAIELTPAQRRWPWLLGWPHFFRVLRARGKGPKKPNSTREVSAK